MTTPRYSVQPTFLTKLETYIIRYAQFGRTSREKGVHLLEHLLNEQALNIAVLDEHYKLIYKASMGVVFIGTSHGGAILASYLSKLLALTFSDKKYVPELAPGSTAITEITRDFRTHTQHVRFVSFFEARGMNAVGVLPFKP
jgi:hypothetical protein